MSDKERSLPKPPTKAFGRKNIFEQEEGQGSLLADRMAAAMAEGKIEEFLKQEMPDNEYARTLATMMMGMTGMMPGGENQPGTPPEKKEESSSESEALPTDEVPEDVKKAIQGGDVNAVMDLLRREHQKRTPAAETEPAEKESPPGQAHEPVIDKELIDTLIRIASENNVTVDWMILRAIKFYVQEYRKTGRL